MTFVDPGARSPVDIQVRLRAPGDAPMDYSTEPDYQEPKPAAKPAPHDQMDYSAEPDYQDQPKPEPAPITTAQDYRDFLKQQFHGPATGPSVGEQMEQGTIDAGNQMRAAAQHTTPNVAAHAPNLLGNLELDEADNYLYKDAGGQLNPVNSQDHVVLQDPADGRMKVFARTPDTNENMFAGLGRFFSQGMGANKITGALPAIKAATPASRLGITLPLAARNPVVAVAGKLLSKLPGSGSLAQSGARTAEQLGGKLEEATAATGGSIAPEVGGSAFEKGIEEGFKPQSRSLLRQLYDGVDAGVNLDSKTPLANTRRYFEELVGKRGGYDDPNPTKGLGVIEGALQERQGLTYPAIKNLRTRIGDMIDDNVFANGLSEKEWRAMYGALTKDLEYSVGTNGSPAALRTFKIANEAADRIETMKDNISKVLGNKLRPDEGVTKAILRMATKTSSDVAALNDAKEAVRPEVWKHFTANALSKLGRTPEGQFDPQQFIEDYGKLSDEGKKALFSGAGQTNLLPFLNDIEQVSGKSLKAAGHVPGLGEVAGHGSMGAVLALAGEKAFEGHYTPALALLGTAIGANLAGRVLGAAPSAASFARWQRAYVDMIRQPSPASFAVFNLVNRNLSNTIADQVGVPAATIEQKLKQAVQSGNQGGNQ
jgi:hypothetical protein